MLKMLILQIVKLVMAVLLYLKNQLLQCIINHLKSPNLAYQPLKQSSHHALYDHFPSHDAVLDVPTFSPTFQDVDRVLKAHFHYKDATYSAKYDKTDISTTTKTVATN